MLHKFQGIRADWHDYRAPCFYLVTITTFDRRPILASCRDNASVYSPDGRIVFDLWRAIPQSYPQIETSTLILMPDHLHGIIRVRERMPKPLGVPIRAFKSQVTSALRLKHGNPELQVWPPGFHDLILLRAGALKAYTDYIRDNPRRYCLKRSHPHLFSRADALQHARLPQEQCWTGYGNLFLLDRPELIPLRISRRATDQEIEEVKTRMQRAVATGAVIVSPCLSSGEKAVADMLMTGQHGDLILMSHDGFGPYYKPHGGYIDLCAQGRLLILSPFQYTGRREKIARETCLKMNAWCEHICAA